MTIYRCKPSCNCSKRTTEKRGTSHYHLWSSLRCSSFVKASLLKGRINVQEGPNGYVTLTGQNVAFLQDSGGQGKFTYNNPYDCKKR